MSAPDPAELARMTGCTVTEWEAARDVLGHWWGAEHHGTDVVTWLAHTTVWLNLPPAKVCWTNAAGELCIGMRTHGPVTA